MTTLPVTLATTGILGLIYLVLSINVVRMRAKSKVMLGDGAGTPEAEAIQVAIRSHGNFAEYVPLALLLLGGIEAAGANGVLCFILAVMLVAGRIAHPFGLSRPAPNLFRAGGAMLTWTMIGLASLSALFLVF